MALTAENTAPARFADDLRGVGQLAVEGVIGLTDVVEAMHSAIGHLPTVIGRKPPTTTTGLTGRVYGTVRGITRLVGTGVDASLAALGPVLGGRVRAPRREAAIAALNGVFGDHLHASGNPLAIRMQLRHAGDAVSPSREVLAHHFPHTDGKVMVFLHGLCMNDLQWSDAGRDRGATLADEFGFSPLHLHYNTGRHVAENGRAFAELLEQLVHAWPVPVEDLILVCHSMGGLVARSAIGAGVNAGHAWASQPLRVVFLGTPHHGAPLERVGSWVDLLLGLSAYSAPIAKIGRARSAGIRDLRHGFLRKGGEVAALPAQVRAYAIAATTERSRKAASVGSLRGDGLVPVASAFGEHADPAFDLRIPAARRWIAHGTHHIGLLRSARVYEQIAHWLRTSEEETP